MADKKFVYWDGEKFVHHDTAADSLNVNGLSTNAPIDMLGNKIVGGAEPTDPSDLSTRNYVDISRPTKDQVAAATTADVTLSGSQTIDGISVSTGDRVLVKDQTSGSENGIYVAGTGAWVRASDMASGSLASGTIVFVDDGTASQADTGWRVATNSGSDVVGTDALTFSTFTSQPMAIDDLADVDTSTSAPTDLEVLTWINGNSKWEPGTLDAGAGAIYFKADGTRNVTGAATFDDNLTLDSDDATLTLGDALGSSVLNLNAFFLESTQINFRANIGQGLVNLWIQTMDDSQDMLFKRRDDFGAVIDTPLKLDYSDGNAYFANDISSVDGTFSGNVGITSGTLDVGGLTTLSGDLTLDSPNAEITLGDGTGSIDLTFQTGTGGADNAEISFLTNSVGSIQRHWIFAHVPATDNLEFKRRSATDGSSVDIPLSLSFSTGDVLMAKNLAVTEEINGKINHYTHHMCTSTSTSKFYMPWGGLTENATITNEGMWAVAPHDGVLESIEVIHDTSGAQPGNSKFGFHKNVNATPTEEITVNMSSNATHYTATFTGTASFSKGDRLSLSFDGTNYPEKLSMTAKWRYDTST